MFFLKTNKQTNLLLHTPRNADSQEISSLWPKFRKPVDVDRVPRMIEF